MSAVTLSWHWGRVAGRSALTLHSLSLRAFGRQTNLGASKAVDVKVFCPGTSSPRSSRVWLSVSARSRSRPRYKRLGGGDRRPRPSWPGPAQ